VPAAPGSLDTQAKHFPLTIPRTVPNSEKLPDGLYERIVTRRVVNALAGLHGSGCRSESEELESADSHEILAWYVYEMLREVSQELPSEGRTALQVQLCNRVLAVLGSQRGEAEDDFAVVQPAARLLSLTRKVLPNGEPKQVPRPHIPLTASDLLVNARGEPRVGHAIEREIASADEIDLICAFVRWNGLRLVLPALKAHCEGGKPLRVITTTYTGSTERRALDELVHIGASVKISYEIRSNRLHAKAWMFHRKTGYSTAYIGSSNLTQWALLDGVEWNVRLSQVTSPEILEKFQATFGTYWEEKDFESYDPERDSDRFDRAIAATFSSDTLQFALIDVIPLPHQREILERLTVERERHGRFRNLIVAATGTGKTIVSALDYRRLREKLGNPRLLFVAHRGQILSQSMAVFRHVLRDGTFGEPFVDGRRPTEWNHVFASVQSLAQVELENLSPDSFDIVIVDEFHHAAADTYRRLLNHLKPAYLLGLTATPERTDGQSVLEWFDGRIAVDLRLWEALERGLLCPFHYFGIHDGTDLSSVKWSRRGYDTTELQNLYTANHARVRLIAQAIHDKIADPRQMRALGFCVSIDHAEFMAREFSRIGLPSAAISARSGPDERERSLRLLRDKQVNILFSVDLFNEGVDIPEVDTVLFLRPTESATVFLQQLGRGLRQFERKSCLTVLDFIGNASRRFRFDRRYQALAQTTRATLVRQLQDGFPFLPAGCQIQLDRVAATIVLENLKASIGSTFRSFVSELKHIGRDVSLREFLSVTLIELQDLYRQSGWTWTRLRREAGLPTAPPGPYEDIASKAHARLLHIDDRRRLIFFRKLLAAPHAPKTADLSETERRILTGLHFALWGDKPPFGDLDLGLTHLWNEPAVRAEMQEVLAIADENATHLTEPLGEPQWASVPLSTHATYSLTEILTAFEEMTITRPYRLREGVKFNSATKSDLFFVTLEKAEKHYSPTTMYKDYAISPELFHWQSQSQTTQQTPTGQRYIQHKEKGTSILLFVRRKEKLDGRTAPYLFLGPAEYVRHEGDRPISFVWRLLTPMPADFFREARMAAGA
jgi:superfamily II DNA or RNA helicase/HKD family nuclease